MSNKQETYVVKFKAHAEGLDSIIKQLSTIAAGGDIKITDKLKTDISVLQKRAQDLLQTLQGEAAKETPSTEVLKLAFKEFQKIAEAAHNIGLDMSTMAVPAKMIEDLKKINDELAKQEEHLAALKDLKRQEEMIAGPKGGATAKARAIAFEQTGGKQLDSGSDAQFESIVDVKAKIKTLKTENKDRDPESEEYKKTAQAIQELEYYVERYNKKLHELVTTAQKNKAAIQQQIEAQEQHIATLREKISVMEAEADISQSQQQLSDSERQALEKTRMLASETVKIRNDQVAALENEKDAQAEAKRAAGEAAEQQRQAQKAIDNLTNGVNNQNKSLNTNTTTFGRAAKQVFTYGTALNVLKRLYNETIKTITDMDKALTGMAVVTSMSREQTWQLVGDLQDLANTTGKTTTEIANMATKFYQQGKSTSQVLQLTEAAAKAATIAGIDGSRSIDLLTNAMNGFQMASSKAMEVSDKFASLAASAATDYEELATALSKVAAQANLAGMSMDFTLGMLTKGIEVTREAPETIGTALKTVISRMRELTDYGKTLEDNVDVNRVEKALGNIGVELRDESGQFRDLEAVLTEVGKKWDTLNKNQQANVAVALAGTRQQSRLIAMMQDFDRTLELVDISANSYGATMAQSAKYMEGLEASTTLLTNAWQKLITSLADSEFIIGAVDMITGLVNGFNDILNNAGAMIPIITALAVIGSGIVADKIQERILQQDVVRLAEQQAHIKREARIKELQGQIQSQKQEQINAKQEQINAKRRQQEDNKRLKREKKLTAEAEIRRVIEDTTLSDAQKQEKINKIKIETEVEINKLNSENRSLGQKIHQDEQELAAIKASCVGTAEQELELKQLQTQEQQYQLEGWDKEQTAVEKLFSSLSGVQKIMSIISTVKAGWLLIEKLITKEKDKQAKVEGKQTKSLLTNALLSAAKSAPWIVAIALIAAAGIAAIAAIDNANEKRTEKTEDSLNKLQAEIYNINQSITTVNKLGNEFDTLSSKIIKTTEDLERMNEIAQQVNDTLGYDAVDLDASTTAQAQQIKGAEARLREEKAEKVQESADTFASEYKANRRAKGYSKEAYVDALGEAGQNTLRNIAINQLEGLAEQSAEAQAIIQDMFIEKAPDMITDKSKFDISAFTKVFDNEQDGGFAGFMAGLEKAAQSDTMQGYVDWLGTLNDDTQELIFASNEYLNSINTLNKTGLLGTLENKGMTKEDINELYALADLQASLTKAEDSASSIFTSMAKKNIDTTQEMYASMMASADEWLEHMKEIGNVYTKDAEYQALQQAKIAKDIEIKEQERKVTKAKKQYGEKSEEYTKELQTLNELEGQYIELEEQERKWTDPEGYVQDMKTRAESLLLVNEAVTTYTDKLTKLGSTLERLSKVEDINKMSLADRMELLKDYPELLKAMEEGNLDAATTLQILNKEFEKTTGELAEDMSDIGKKYQNDADEALLKQAGLSEVFSNGALAGQWLTGGKDAFEKAMKDKGLTSDQITRLWGDIEDYANKDYLLNTLNEGGIAALAETDFDFSKQTNAYNRFKAIVDGYEEELGRLDEGSDAYKEALEKRNAALTDHLNQIDSMIDKDGSQLDKIFGTNEAFTANDLAKVKDAFDIINGEIIINADAYDRLNSTQRAALHSQMEALEEYAKKQKELTDEQIEGYQTLAQAYVDEQTRMREAEIEALEERKAALEQYFSEVDALDAEADRAEQHDSLVTQIAALTGALDGSSKSKIKELQSQLQQLQEEELQAQKERQRDALYQSIDTHIENLNTAITKLSESLWEFVKILMEGGTLPNDATPAPTYKGDIPQNAKGGLVNYTGLAWVDGTPTQPEAFLSATDVRLIQDLVSSLKLTPVENTSGGVAIGEINIHTDHLDNNQDFAQAGETLAEAFDNAIRRRGINVNARK